MRCARGVRTFCAVLVLAATARSSGYDEPTAVWYANLAGAAYCDAESLSSWSCGKKCLTGASSVTVCQGNATRAFVGLWARPGAERCVTSFEGTNGLMSSLEDLDTVPRLLHGVHVHAGFLREWQSLQPCVSSALLALGCGDPAAIRSVGITGHSLGGAVASIAAFDVGKQDLLNVSEVYTFGMPRVGYKYFAREFELLYKGRFFRVTHGRDPFVHMPASFLYVHLEPEVFYPGDVHGGYVICWKDGDAHCSGQFWFGSLSVFSAKDVSFHHTYLGVDTTQLGCVGRSGQNCSTGDIENSWCNRVVPCNADVRGPDVSCHYGGGLLGTGGKCHCNEGFCHVAGHCEPTPGLAAAPPALAAELADAALGNRGVEQPGFGPASAHPHALTSAAACCAAFSLVATALAWRPVRSVGAAQDDNLGDRLLPSAAGGA